jgi:ElaB/YqjD/DUF883 family membrane-anchored ribosome-binding protein
MESADDTIEQFRNEVESLDGELEQVVSSYKESVSAMQAAVNELNDALFSAIRNHIDEVEHVVIKEALRSASQRIKVAKIRQDNICAMEEAFIDLRCRYSAVLGNNGHVECDGSVIHMGRALEFDTPEPQK